MNPNIAVAPAPRNLMQDIAPPKPAIPVAAAPAPQAASSFLPQPQPVAPVPAASPIAPPPASVQPKQVPQTPVKPQIQQAQRNLQRPKSTTPLLPVVIAMVITAALVFAALYTYRQS